MGAGLQCEWHTSRRCVPFTHGLCMRNMQYYPLGLRRARQLKHNRSPAHEIDLAAIDNIQNETLVRIWEHTVFELARVRQVQIRLWS